MSSEDKFEKFVGLASKDAGKASERVAKAFYRILRKNGFTNEQIVSVAGDILDCLCNAYQGYTSKPKGKKKKANAKNVSKGQA